jgi:predicted MFS family arabinose efflux permease
MPSFRVIPNPRFYGWVIVASGFAATALSSPGQSFLLGLYLASFVQDVGLSAADLASIYAIATLCAAVFLPLLGRLLDRYHARAFLTGVVFVMGLVMVLLGQVTTPLGLAVGFFFVRLLGQGALGLGALTASSRWFERYRGRAVGIVSLGYAFGELVFPTIVLALISTIGWRSSLWWLGWLYALLFAPLMLLLLRERRHNEPLDGETEILGEGVIPTTAWRERQTSVPLRAALRQPIFWWLTVTSMVSPMVLTAILFHQVGLFAAQGWAASLVPTALMAYAVTSVVATYATGLMLERVPSRFGFVTSLLAMALAAGSLALELPPLAGAVVFGGLLGATSGMASAANGQVWPDYFGVESLGAIRGVITAFRNGAAALGPPLLALVGTGAATGSGVVLFCVLVGLGALAVIVLPGPRRVVHT